MVGTEIDYVAVTAPDGHDYVLAEARVAAYKKELYPEPTSPRSPGAAGAATCSA